MTIAGLKLMPLKRLSLFAQLGKKKKKKITVLINANGV